MNEYTPSQEPLMWEDIRRRWAASEFADSVGPGEWAYEHADFGPLDRWLASERVRIFDEGRALGADLQADGWNSERYDPQVHNPYLNGGDA